MWMADAHQLQKTMAYLLRRRGGANGLRAEAGGWVPVNDLAAAVSDHLRLDVQPEELTRLARGRRGGNGPRFDFDVNRGRVRMTRGRRSRPNSPDILYHATTADMLDRFRSDGALTAGRGRRVFLSATESQAWRVAHRFHKRPEVLFVDAGRARRQGVHIYRNRSGLYLVDRVPIRHVLNLRPGFRQQFSAGGILLREVHAPDAPGGQRQELALIRCVRRSGVTWEIAKGKLEPGEAPEVAACREVGEEMGFEAEIAIERPLGVVRYGFQTPEGEPRLKSLFVYLMRPDPVPEVFTPAKAEGICDVRWFPVHEACRRVTHPSLLRIVQRLRQVLG